MNSGSRRTEPAVHRLPADAGVMRGRIVSYTLLQEAPAGFDAQAPYYLALVELPDGALITAQLTDMHEDLRIGADVEMVTRKLTTDGQRGTIVYGYKFRPPIA